MTLTREEFVRLRAEAASKAVPCFKVRDAEEARRMSEQDPFGYKWEVGDEYYLLERQRMGL